jgi:predicted kinase
VLVGGIPGSGKSTLANSLGDVLGAIVLRSDDIRAGQPGPLADRSVTTPFGQGRYTPDRTQAVYKQLINVARQHLGLGRSVVLDASWIDASNRGLARALAIQASADLTELHCTAPPAVTEERIVMRLQDGTGPSEATVEIGQAMALLQDPWPSATAIDTARPPGVVLAEALRIVGAPVVEVSSTG